MMSASMASDAADCIDRSSFDCFLAKCLCQSICEVWRPAKPIHEILFALQCGLVAIEMIPQPEQFFSDGFPIGTKDH